jgi:hypothetical protein
MDDGYPMRAVKDSLTAPLRAKWGKPEGIRWSAQWETIWLALKGEGGPLLAPLHIVRMLPFQSYPR